MSVKWHLFFQSNLIWCLEVLLWYAHGFMRAMIYMHHGCPRTRMIFCLMSGDSTSRDFALICSCSSKTGVKFNDRYILEQWRQVRQTRLSHQSNLHSKAMDSLAPVVQHNMGCHRRAASCSERKCDAELVHLHFDSDPNLPVSREKYDLSMESKDPRSK